MSDDDHDDRERAAKERGLALGDPERELAAGEAGDAKLTAREAGAGEARDAKLTAREAKREARELEREVRERTAAELEREARAMEREAEELEREIEREAADMEREAEREAREIEREAARLERSAKDVERLAIEVERDRERAAKDAERVRERADKDGERAAKDAERLREREAKDAERAAKELERTRERDAKDAERATKERERLREREAKDREREARERERQKVRAAKDREQLDSLQARRAGGDPDDPDDDFYGHGGHGHGEGDDGHGDHDDDHEHDHHHGHDHDGHGHGHGGPYRHATGDGHSDGQSSGDADAEARAPWDWRRSRNWQRFERAMRRQAEQRARWEARRAEHRARWKKRKKHWHAEREMWMRHGKGKRAWGPWWLQARMRKRIFIWLTLAFASGAIGMHYWPRASWWHVVLAMFVLSTVSGIIAFRLTRPLIMMIRVAQDIGDGKLETRLDIDRHRGETRLLAMAINEMAERIEQQLKDQRQLLAAVSHELRTPLGHMRVLIDTARASNDRKALGELEREVLVLDDLVGRLLASSRLEFGNLDCRPLDLGALVTDCATAAGVPPEAIEAIGDVRATVDPTLVTRAVANLLDNARVHGGGAVAVRIERRARQVAIEVDDNGPGVPADRRADAFRAFVPSRGGGLGLGLALVSRIAVAHNGGAWITDRPGGGARVGFTVELEPSVPASDPA